MPSSIITRDKCFELIKKKKEKEKDLNAKHEKSNKIIAVSVSNAFV